MVLGRVYLMTTAQTHAKFGQSFACVCANLLRILSKLFAVLGKWAISLAQMLKGIQY